MNIQNLLRKVYSEKFSIFIVWQYIFNAVSDKNLPNMVPKYIDIVEQNNKGMVVIEKKQVK